MQHENFKRDVAFGRVAALKSAKAVVEEQATVANAFVTDRRDLRDANTHYAPPLGTAAIMKVAQLHEQIG